MILTFLAKNWKNVAIGLLAIFCVLSMQTCSVNKQDKEALESSIGILQDSVEHYRGKAGELVSQVKTQELTLAQLKDFGDKLNLDNAKLKKQVGNLNRLVGYWQVQASISDTFTLKEIDTVYLKDNKPVAGKSFKYNNGYLKLDQVYTPDAGTLTTAYDYKVDLELTVYRKGKNIFRRGELVSDIRFKDQNLSVTEMKAVVVKEPPKAWYETGLAKFLFGVGVGTFLGSR
jgi:hypothetical protein